ncbi:MAG: T9SS type A sorting domain-containing protein, partial [Bacteroidales bacterium]|nr:T9SS type A sorting domain-containing protein [Bacteroidales bacterium]
LVSYNPVTNERTDCPVIAADIDGDDDKEVLYMAIRDGRGYVRAVNLDKTSVSGWSGDTHFISLTSDDMNYAWPPYFSVADIDNDGEIEVFAADKDTLKMWNGDGTPFGTGYIRIPNLDGRYFQPVIADIDGFGDCEVIVPSQNGYIHAYKTNGNTVPGWPLAVTELATIPVVTDLDGDGLNEVVAASKTGLYVWHTEGVSDRNQCDRFRYNRHNNAVYEIPCSHIGTPLEISGTQVWNDDRRFNRDVIVNSGGHLTVKSELRLSGDSKIIVKPGGRLILDGCTITNSCPGGIWPGIEVWGDSDAHQQEVNGGYLQGYVELKNGATIENARCALRLRNPLVSGTSGGIVHADDAHFVNNALAVEACSYTNHGTLSQREIDYHGWFHDCTFTVDEDFPAQAAFHCHASLTEVNGLNFEGCAFSVNRSVDSVDFQCSAIHAYNAAFKATRHCDSQTLPCPSASVTRSSFSGFYRAVESLCDGQNTRTVMVRDADFSGNDVGVYALNTPLAAVLGNTFAVGGRMDCSFGIWLEGVAVCQVEENSFASASGTNSTTYGAAFKNSEAANDVYRNQFSGLDYANLAIGRNAIVTGIGGHPSVTTGLTYTCNTNSGNGTDFRIDDFGDYSGIQPVQGSSAMAAGNTFSGSNWHIHNAGDYPITYYYYSADPDQTPSRSKLSQTTATSTTNSNHCRTHYGDDPIRLSQAATDSLVSVWNAAREDYLSLLRLYQSLSTVETADSSALAGIAAGMTERAHTATMAAGDILRSLADSPASESGEMRRWLAVLACPSADRLAVASLLESGDTEEALALALSMNGKYDPKQLDPVEQQEYTDLIKLYADLRRSGRNAFGLTDSEKAAVERIAQEGTGQAQSLAKALVEGIGGERSLMTCPSELTNGQRGGDKAHGNQTLEMNDSPSFAVNVIPTPARTWITVEYTLPEGCSNAIFELTSMTGVKVLSVELGGNEGSKTLDLRKLPRGVYLYTVNSSGHSLTGKVVITK